MHYYQRSFRRRFWWLQWREYTMSCSVCFIFQQSHIRIKLRFSCYQPDARGGLCDRRRFFWAFGLCFDSIRQQNVKFCCTYWWQLKYRQSFWEKSKVAFGGMLQPLLQFGSDGFSFRVLIPYFKNSYIDKEEVISNSSASTTKVFSCVCQDWCWNALKLIIQYVLQIHCALGPNRKGKARRCGLIYAWCRVGLHGWA